MSPAARPDVPDVGDTFRYRMRGSVAPGADHFRVDAWLKPSRIWEVTRGGVIEQLGWVPDKDPLIEELRLKMRSDFPQRGASKDNLPLTFCARQDATHVSGYGVCGVILPLYEVIVDGRVRWADELLDSERRHAELLIGERLS